MLALREWSGRINHIHLKDARRELLASIVTDRAPMEEIWRRRAFCALGDGDVGMDEVLAAIAGIGYSGWLVVEQDSSPTLPSPRRRWRPARPPTGSGCASAASEWGSR